MEYQTNNYTVDKQNTENVIKADVRQKVITFLMEAIEKEFGPDAAVTMVRTGNTTKTNEIGFIAGVATNDGEDVPIVVTLNPTVKTFVARKTDKRTYVPFDLAEAKAAYETYIDEKEAKAAEAAEKKAKKIAADQAARAKKAEAAEG
jgi:hypothetical protein